MRSWIIICMVNLVIIGAVCSPGFSEIQSQEDAPLVQQPMDISLTLQQMREDDRGTDVSNIYTISVDYTNQNNEGGIFNLMYFEDGRYVQEFKGITLPFSFSRNYKGLTQGAHEVRIDLEDMDLRIVGRKTSTVTVNDE